MSPISSPRPAPNVDAVAAGEISVVLVRRISAGPCRCRSGAEHQRDGGGHQQDDDHLEGERVETG
jgi:hypothetical protein